ncbi:MAG: glycosyltransferase family 2 protein [Selenomonadaceae bacterium]|nr:glycosyltransferase family 2 protein [Selenomonadaceae bacterium]
MDQIKPSVSVVMPVYNVERYVEQSIKSVLNQTFKDFELIIVDDASTDRSAEICQSVADTDSRINIIHHEKNGGLSAARNTGMLYARGKYIFFPDSDDLLVDNALDKYFSAAESSGADIVHCTRHMERLETVPGEFDERVRLKNDRGIREGMMTANRNARLYDYYVKFGVWVMVWRNFYRREFLERNHLTFPSIISEDEVFLIGSLCLADKFYCLADPLYIYTRRRDSITNCINEDKVRKGICSIVQGCRWLNRLVSRLPNGMLELQVKNFCVQEFIRRMTNNYVLRYCDSYAKLMSEKSDRIMLEALRPSFIEDTDIVVQLFQRMAFAQLESLKLARSVQQNKISSKVESPKH